MQAVFAALCDNQLAGGCVGEERLQHIVQSELRASGIVMMVMHLPAVVAQDGSEVAHGAKNQRDFLLVVRNITGLSAHFGHDNPVAVFFKVLQTGYIGGELVTQDQSDFHSLG
jgi:hypothetical protein